MDDIILAVPQKINVQDLINELEENLSEERMKSFILSLDLMQQDLNFSLTLIEDLLCSIKESIDEDEKHLVDEARSLLDEIGWR